MYHPARQVTHMLDGAGVLGWPCGQVVLTAPPYTVARARTIIPPPRARPWSR